MFLITSLVPLFLFSAVSISSFGVNSRKNTYQANHDKMEIVKAEVNGMLDKHFTTLHTIANQPAVRNFDLEELVLCIEK